tara:strand:+ start:3487 stop:3939 length:453 start_codon:yes stop_codon:yes gene_type:complete
MGDYTRFEMEIKDDDVIGAKDGPLDPRPQMSMDLRNAYNLTLNEKQKIDNLVKEEYSTKHTTILDESLGDILDKTFNFLGNFVAEYKLKYDYADALLNIDVDDSNRISNVIILHLTSISLLIRESDNIIYIGILFVILSIIIYFFNISRN